MANPAWEKTDRDPCPVAKLSAGSLRVTELDAMRGIGVSTVIGFHLWPGTFFFGWTRADLFFVISGFLITQVIIRHGSSRGFILRFWARRALRIWPAYYLMLVILFVTASTEGRPPPTGGLVAHATFTQNLPYYWSTSIPNFPRSALQTWSLAIEEQFYLLWPVVAVWMGRGVLVPASLWLIVTSVAMRLNGVYPAVALARADGLALGAILAVLVYRQRAINSVGRGTVGAGPHPTTPVRSWKLNVALCVTAMLGLYFGSGPLTRYEEPIPGISGCGSYSILAINVVYCSVVGLVVLNAGHRVLGPLRCARSFTSAR